MNPEHLRICGSREWAELLGEQVLPWVLDGVELGDDVLEVGPGPGVTTDVLRERVERLTVVELDPDLATDLADRLRGTNVGVLRADGTTLPFDTGRFSAATCFTMLHHVPSPELQDRLFMELRRVVRPGGMIVGSDSVETEKRRDLHVGDVYQPVRPAELGSRLEAAGLVGVEVEVGPGDLPEPFFRFSGRVGAPRP